ncbi:MAG: hypothetical protein IJQ45_09945 [Clostridia bacterium]|jgi:hypothetical protein|nr:hypothetical protein [Clostridia bacterium]
MRNIRPQRKAFVRLALIAMALACVLLSVACENDTMVYKCRIKQAPTRTEYPVGYSGNIDMTGSIVVGVRVNGSDASFNIEKYKPLSAFNGEGPADTIYWDDSGVDFSIPGEYTVFVYYLNEDKADDSFRITVR